MGIVLLAAARTGRRDGVIGPAWITATPPTPNGPLHLGHLAGPYIAGDVLRRFLVAEGSEVRYTSGLDDYQSYVPVRGLSEGGRKPEEIADEYGASLEDAWHRFDVEFDLLVHPRTDAGYPERLQDFFLGLYRDGHIVSRRRPLPYCASCERWLYEAYVKGGCPHCGSSSNGNACEPCGRPNDCADLAGPVCTVCDGEAESRECERLYFPLAPFGEYLEAFWAQVRMPPHLRSLCEQMRAEGLPEIAVSHPGEWGVPVPVPGFAEHKIYVWFEMAAGYLEQWDAAGTGAPPPSPVQFFGFDNGYFHGLLFPAVFRAIGAPPPRAFVVNEFYLLEGAKFSTSRRHVVWALEALERSGTDTLRYHLLAGRPDGRQTNFTEPEFQRSREHLSRHWDGWLLRLFSDVERYCSGRVPTEPPSGEDWDLLHGRLVRTAEDLRNAYDLPGFDPRRAIALLDEMVAGAADYGHVHGHERDRPDGAPRHRAALAAQLAVASALSVWAAPIMPAGAERLARALGVSPGGRVSLGALAVPTAGSPVSLAGTRIFGD